MLEQKVLITGYTGFIGNALLPHFSKSSLVLIGRQDAPSTYGSVYCKRLDASEQFFDCLENVSVIVHCAARVHIINDKACSSITAFKDVNTFGTLNLARQAASAGVKRFIFVSSIKVNGESTSEYTPFYFNDNFYPRDPYGASKAEAEIELKKLAIETGMEVVIIRPTLVYGPGVKANFASLMNLVSKGIPLPFGSITQNKRSLVSINNLVDLIVTCIDHPKAANQVFLVSDDHDVSTSEMVRELAIALGKPTWQLPVPIWCYKLFGKLFGKSDIVDRLTGSLQVDISHTKETLGWKPPQTLQDGFKQTAQAFLQAKNK
ncbi:SDR family oxidoreductase [Vibrio cholerae]|uniref:UDP-glucose 4-epimerase family protein n=1 Tax=Vibrio cholerae TaxID=666 RepID=UPI001157AD45|nr:SDR family oxidoreductase [Vibrio cholerae]EGR1448222.1 SDR family oxidoreductase [Vibrio cholerae]EGR2397686.1 SDR family oxidoreductase [Vibrio cholerae]EGR2401372.1 SDR family oxidoreductase [Vibrio cholerae]EGR2529558.1 SDR family oxidoreductase [Vibrio cholerae]EII3728908.1 SDR family oxidoreductase [Vibrio cholerae]